MKSSRRHLLQLGLSAAATGLATGFTTPARALQMQTLDAPAARAYAARCTAAGDGFHDEIIAAMRAELARQGTPADPARIKTLLNELGACPYCGCGYAELADPPGNAAPKF